MQRLPETEDTRLLWLVLMALGVGPVPSLKIANALLRATTRSQRSSFMSYKKVQMIGYEIYTGPSDPGTDNAAYVGLASDTDDIKARIKLMSEAVGNAQSSRNIDTSSETLKIFMAPEFFYRGKDGAYDVSFMAGEQNNPQVPSLVTEMSDLVKGASFKDWLFVFGTGIFQSLDPKTNMYEIYNVALVQKGGYSDPDDQIANRVVCMKEFKSGIDFLELPPTGLTDFNTTHLPPLGGISYTGEINTPNAGPGGGYNGGSIFNLDNITFGLEICLDHAERRLVRAYPGRGQQFVQIQLIPSGGMSIESAAVATALDGSVFNVDGLSNTAGNAYGHHAVLNTVDFSFPRSDADLTNVGVTALENANADLNAVQQVFYIPAGEDPKLAIFPSQAIAAPAAAPM